MQVLQRRTSPTSFSPPSGMLQKKAQVGKMWDRHTRDLPAVSRSRFAGSVLICLLITPYRCRQLNALRNGDNVIRRLTSVTDNALGHQKNCSAPDPDGHRTIKSEAHCMDVQRNLCARPSKSVHYAFRPSSYPRAPSSFALCGRQRARTRHRCSRNCANRRRLGA